jgi:hypothetical protein
MKKTSRVRPPSDIDVRRTLVGSSKEIAAPTAIPRIMDTAVPPNITCRTPRVIARFKGHPFAISETGSGISTQQPDRRSWLLAELLKRESLLLAGLRSEPKNSHQGRFPRRSHLPQKAVKGELQHPNYAIGLSLADCGPVNRPALRARFASGNGLSTGRAAPDDRYVSELLESKDGFRLRSATSTQST